MPSTAKPVNVAKILKKKQEEEANQFDILDTGKKEKRNIVDLKANWVVDEIREDYKQKLEEQLILAFGEPFSKKLMSKDFNVHVKCIEQFKQSLDNPDLQFKLIEVSDLIFKWVFIKTSESSNTTLLKEALFFIEYMIQFYVQNGISLHEGEGQILLTMLVEKTGVNNAILKDKTVEILKAIGVSKEVFPIEKSTVLFMRGLTSKNSKTKAEILSVIEFMAETHQMTTLNDKYVKLIGKEVDSTDANI